MNEKNGDDIKRIANYCELVLNLREAEFGPEYFYQSLPFCVIDAVFSLGVRYEGTRRTVMSYCDYFNLQRIRKDKKMFPPKEEQESVESFKKKIESLGIERFANEIFHNRQRTSTKGGILKSEAVLKFASVLTRFGVNYFQDVPKVIRDERFEREIRNIPGQKSGISLRYFFMLCGSDELIKPDRMILRFLEVPLKRVVGADEAQLLLPKVATYLRSSYPNLTPRLLDQEIWSFQRQKPLNSKVLVEVSSSPSIASEEELNGKTKTSQKEEVTMDAKLYIMRLIETHEHRIRPQGVNFLSDKQREFYKVIENMARNSSDKTIFRDDIVNAYERKFGIEPNWLPTDFCYNLVNRGPDFETKFLLIQDRGKFKFVGFDWTGDDRRVDIKWTPKGKDVPLELRGRTFTVGTYHNGIYSWNFKDLRVL